ncbi:hypothetical protein FQN60_014399, partial [Etheostoma spectabile]
IKRWVASAVNPTFHNSFEDVHILFEIVLDVIHCENGEVLVQMLSWLLSARQKPESHLRIEAHLWLLNHIGHLHQDDVERTLLTLLNNAQEMANSTTEQHRDA